MRSVTPSTKCRQIIQQTVVLVAVLMLMNSFSLSFVQAQSCTVFGNPPRGNVFAVEPFCGIGGSLVGGFNDSEGTPRFACLYPPSAPVRGVQYPMIVFLHPSLANADSVKLTPLFEDRNTANIMWRKHHWIPHSCSPGTQHAALLSVS
jgi:hypothetical protein